MVALMVQRDPRFEREHTGPEVEIKVEMERRLAQYFAKKYGQVWRWCPQCRVWDIPHRHQAVSNG